MTTTLKKLPAILLAVIMAAALAVGLCALSQPAYAEDDDSGELYLIVVPAEDGDDVVLPGQKVLMEATVYDDQGDNVTGQVMIQNPQWAVTNGAEYAEYEPVEGNPLQGYLAFKNMPADLDVDEVNASLQLTAEIGGKVQVSNAYPILCARSFYKMVSTELDRYMMPGASQDVTAQVLRFSEENPEGTPVSDVAFEWVDFNKNVVDVNPLTATGDSITSTVTRKSEDWDFFMLQATWKDETGEEQNEYDFFSLEERSSDLTEYEVEVDAEAVSWRTFIEEGATYVPDIKVVNGDFELPRDAYDIKVQRYVGFDPESGEDIYEDYCTNWDKELAVSPRDEKDAEGRPIGGTNSFKITAVAKEGSGYTGSTDEFPGYCFLYSTKTLNDYAANVVMDDASGQPAEEVFTDVYPYFRFEVNPGTVLTPYVSINDVPLKAGTDYTCKYVNLATGAESSEFPTEIGEYCLTVEGAGSYYGSDDSTYIKVGETNTMKVKAPAVKAKSKKNTVKKKAIKVTTNGPVFIYKYTVNGKYSGKPYNKINVKDDGTITVKKGLKKGTYKLELLISTPGDEQHLTVEKEITVKIKVK